MKMEVLLPLQKKDASHAGTVLANIFQHDPVWQVLFRDASPHLDKLAGRLRRGPRLVVRLVCRQSITKRLIHTYFGEIS